MVSKDRFEPKNSRFRQGATMIARMPLPGAATVPTNITQILIARMGRPFAVPVPPNAGIPTRGNGNLYPWAMLLQGLVHLPAVIRTVSGSTGQRAFHFLQQRPNGLGIVNAGFGQFHRLNFTAFTVYAQVNLPPGAPPGIPVLTDFPFPFSIDLQAAAVQNQVQRPLGLLGKTNGHSSASAGEGGMVRHRQRDAKFLEKGTEKALRPSVGEMIDFPKGEHHFNGCVAVHEGGSPMRRAVVEPALYGIIGNPEGHCAPLDQSPVVFRPVFHPVRGLPGLLSPLLLFLLLGLGMFSPLHNNHYTSTLPSCPDLCTKASVKQKGGGS
jgi:hypothetical protein